MIGYNICTYWLQYKIKRNEIIKLIRIKKKKYYENIIDLDKENPTNMWKISKNNKR
jgi:hypothetical protein